MKTLRDYISGFRNKRKSLSEEIPGEIENDNDPDDETPSLSVDTTDPTDKMYEEWKKTGKIPGQNSEFPIRNNALYDTFKKRKEKENETGKTYPNIKKSIQGKAILRRIVKKKKKLTDQ